MYMEVWFCPHWTLGFPSFEILKYYSCRVTFSLAVTSGCVCQTTWCYVPKDGLHLRHYWVATVLACSSCSLFSRSLWVIQLLESPFVLRHNIVWQADGWRPKSSGMLCCAYCWCAVTDTEERSASTFSNEQLWAGLFASCHFVAVQKSLILISIAVDMLRSCA
jgi:hypothetical protein